MPKLANRQVRDAVNKRQLFKNNNDTLYSDSTSHELYVVYSYGTHYPMYVYDNIARQWFGNETRSSSTTERHKTHARPDGDIRWASTDYLRAMILAGSYVNHTAQRVMRKLAA